MAADKIEIRGLGDIVRDAKRGISEVREHSAGLRDDTRALKKTLVEVREHVNNVHDDLRFEVGTLGNGGWRAGELADILREASGRAPRSRTRLASAAICDRTS